LSVFDSRQDAHTHTRTVPRQRGTASKTLPNKIPARERSTFLWKTAHKTIVVLGETVVVVVVGVTVVVVGVGLMVFRLIRFEGIVSFVVW
jgi:hypothetical protein